MMGPALEVLGESDMALAGADMALTVNRQPVPMWQAVRVMKGDMVRDPPGKSGYRAYLAVTGGIDVPVVMGSRATCVKAKIGGLEGRPLKKDDVLAAFLRSSLARPRTLHAEIIPVYPPDIVLRAVAGPQEEAFRSTTFFGGVPR